MAFVLQDPFLSTIIVKDDETKYSFDTSVIEHLTYPKDLRYHSIENFKIELRKKIEKTYATFLEDPSKYSTFLKNFGSFKVPEIDEKVLPMNEYIVEELRSIKGDISQIKLRENVSKENNYKDISRKNSTLDIYIKKVHFSFYSLEEAKSAQLKFDKMKMVTSRKENAFEVTLPAPTPLDAVNNMIRELNINIGFDKLINGIAYFDDIPF